MVLSSLAVQPRPRYRTRILGYKEDRIRLPFYIGVSSGINHEPVYLRLPSDRSFLVSILIQGPSGSGKSITTRILIENFYLEWKRFGSNWRHPIIIFDSKTNYLGLDKPNRKPRDRYLLKTIHPDWNFFPAIPKDLIHVYMPAYCFTPETKVPTLEGFKRIADVKIGDFVLTHSGRFKRVINTIKRWYVGYLVGIKPRYFPDYLWVTPEHPFYVSDRKRSRKQPDRDKMTVDNIHWADAQSLTTKNCLLIPRTKDMPLSLHTTSLIKRPVVEIDGKVYPYDAYHKCIQPNCHSLPANLPLSEDFLSLAGYYIAEGSLQKRIILSFGSHETDLIDDAKQVIRGVGLNPYEFSQPCRHSHAIYASSVLMESLFSNLFGDNSYVKKFPLSFLMLPSSKLGCFFNKMFKGDGYPDHHRGTKLLRYSTVSEELARCLILCLAKLGAPATLKRCYRRGKIEYEIATRANWLIGGKVKRHAHIDENYIHIPIEKTVRKFYVGYVYNLQVEDDETYTAEFFAVHNCAPTDKRGILKEMRRKWQAEGFWGVPWRHITDLAHLGTVLKVPEATLWAEELRPTFEKCSIDPNMTLKGLIGIGGALHQAAKKIRNTASRNAALSFVERWRKNRFWFAETDKLAEHLEDPFSINVLTFVETPEKIYFNQLALLIALESLMATLQESKSETQPVIIIHDILNFLGEDKPFRSQIIDAIRRLLAGQPRTLAHGYVVILETQSLDLPKELGDYKKYTIHLRLKWKSQSETLRKIPGFIGGIMDVHDHFNNFHKPSVVVRPPLTSYTV
jgi:hypothetical protein